MIVFCCELNALIIKKFAMVIITREEMWALDLMLNSSNDLENATLIVWYANISIIYSHKNKHFDFNLSTFF